MSRFLSTAPRTTARAGALAILSLLSIGSFLTPSANAAERPNVLWISCEDISSHLGCYGDPNAVTPHLDQLAKEGVRFTHAFTCHGVCAPSRTGIITGMSPISLGANHMRSKAQLPKHVKCFPQYLKEHGYYCTNNSKTDYNFEWVQRDVWDQSSGKAHWKNRLSNEQPFFAVFNLTMTHESKIWPEGWAGVVKDLPEAQRHSPAKVSVPPLYPDTPDVRDAFAKLFDLITVMDQEAGRLLQELDEAGLAEDTIVIFWSDHGNGLPRAKRWVYDSGTRVPMIVRIPEKFRSAGQGRPGTTDDRLISLIDLGPTVLNLTGLPIPEQMQGQAFLGQNLPPAREFIYGARDRIDERFDLVRSVRDRRFRYVRNLMPWRPALQHVAYSERSVVRKELRRLLADGTLKRESAQFFDVPRAPEELYDLETDPWELHNLAADPSQAATLQRLSAECDRWQLSIRDAHLIPEPILDAEEQRFGSRWQILHASNGEARCAALLNVAREASRIGHSNPDVIRKAVESDDEAIRWWAVSAMGHHPQPGQFLETLQSHLQDASPTVRIAAAQGLIACGQTKDAFQLLVKELHHDSQFVRHAAIMEIDEAGPPAIKVAQQTIEAIGRDEYVGRIAEHALATLKASR